MRVQLHPTLWDLMDYSPPGSSVCGIFQARTLEYVQGSLNAPRDQTSVSWIASRFLATEPSGKPRYIHVLHCAWSPSHIEAPRSAALQAPLSMGFSRQNTRVGCHSLLQGILPTQVSRIAGGFFTIWAIRMKPKNTGVGSWSLLQGICPTRESNWGVSCIAGGFFTSWAVKV